MLLSTSNELGFPVLSLVVFLPLAGAIVVALVDEHNRSLHHALGVAFSGMTLGLAAYLLWAFDSGWSSNITSSAFQFADPAHEPAAWLPGGITYHVALDGISVVLVFLAALLTCVALLFSWGSVRRRVREYVFLMLLLETGLIGVFAALDLFLFYVFWELVLIPMYFLIGIWGGPGRIYATLKFVLFTMAGSAFMLVAIVGLVLMSDSGSFHLFEVLQQPLLDGRVQLALFVAFALAFAVKVPLFPLHTWLPDAHVEAPTAGSVILAGVLLKLGAYGFVRLGIPLFPDAAAASAGVIMALAVVGIWYGAMVAFAQKDIKSLVAYSSVSHMGLVIVGLFTFNVMGVSGGVLHMVNHGLSTGALFILVGILYDRAHTRRIDDFGGLFGSMPRFAAMFMVVMFASIALPGTNGFVGEWLTLAGAYQAAIPFAVLAAFGVVLGAVYMLWAYQRMFFGPPSKLSTSMPDLSGREMLALLPLLILILWIGLYPDMFLGPIASASEAWVLFVDSATSLAATP